jgi:DNA-binding response OmpR family regulator
VDAVLRRLTPEPQHEPPLRFGGLTIAPAARRVWRDGELCELTPREFDLLLYLARYPGRAFSRENLMDAVWQYSFYSDTSTVTVHVRRLRSKLEVDPTRPRWLQTVWGVGYRFQP